MTRVRGVSPPRDGEELGNDLLAAKERDLEPLREESIDALDLEPDQATTLVSFLDSSWLSGLRAAYDQMRARATEREPDLRAVAVERLESEFKVVMEEAAERLNLSLTGTISMWSMLHQAWMAGNRSGEAELMALYLEVNSDVAEEVRRWLDSGGDSKPPH
jgi:hypothetical protein